MRDVQVYRKADRKRSAVARATTIERRKVREMKYGGGR
jgi:hypothetical protein